MLLRQRLQIRMKENRYNLNILLPVQRFLEVLLNDAGGKRPPYGGVAAEA